jgi:hypothetical protein
MPGAPNRPPERAEETPPAPPVPDPPEKKVLRRLVPTHVALLLDSWKGPPSPELTAPFEKAEAALAAGDFPGALGALDQESIRFAEPRWPSLPAPFRLLRVPIPAPMPPSWDPENALPPAEREARKARRTAEEQVQLAEGSLAWASAHGIAVEDLLPKVAAAKASLAEPGVPPELYGNLDPMWTELRSRLPRPKTTAARPTSAPGAGPGA